MHGVLGRIHGEIAKGISVFPVMDHADPAYYMWVIANHGSLSLLEQETFTQLLSMPREIILLGTLYHGKTGFENILFHAKKVSDPYLFHVSEPLNLGDIIIGAHGPHICGSNTINIDAIVEEYGRASNHETSLTVPGKAVAEPILSLDDLAKIFNLVSGGFDRGVQQIIEEIQEPVEHQPK